MTKYSDVDKIISYLGQAIGIWGQYAYLEIHSIEPFFRIMMDEDFIDAPMNNPPKYEKMEEFNNIEEILEYFRAFFNVKNWKEEKEWLGKFGIHDGGSWIING
jgi:hypothetical protein